jgi:MFS family permease
MDNLRRRLCKLVLNPQQHDLLPAITALAESLHTSIANIDLTVTSYLVVSAIVPATTGGLADTSGRRPVFIVLLTIYVGANVGLALQSSYPALLVLRMVQSIGISGKVI